MQVAVSRERRLSRKDLEKLVSSLLGNATRRAVVHLMEQFETFQAFHREGVEGPDGESFEGARGHPPASGMRCRPVADLCRFRMETGPLEDNVGSQLTLADTGLIFLYGEAPPFSGRPAGSLDFQPLHRIIEALDRVRPTTQCWITMSLDQRIDVSIVPRTQEEGRGRRCRVHPQGDVHQDPPQTVPPIISHSAAAPALGTTGRTIGHEVLLCPLCSIGSGRP